MVTYLDINFAPHLYVPILLRPLLEQFDYFLISALIYDLFLLWEPIPHETVHNSLQHVALDRVGIVDGQSAAWTEIVDTVMLGEIIQAAKTKYVTAVKRKRCQQ